MELVFEYTENIVAGSKPAVVHLANGDVYLFSVLDGRLMYRKWVTADGDVPWDEPAFDTAKIGTEDKNMSLVRLKSMPRVGIFGSWHQNVVYEGSDMVSPERHRFAVWDDENDMSRFLRDCSIEMAQGNPIMSVRITLDNPSQYVSGEQDTRLMPGMRIEPRLVMGDSEEYPMGVHYIDRIDMGVTKDTVSIEGRSITGKLLKDQTLDEDNVFPYQTYYLNIVKMLEDASIEFFDVQPNLSPTAWKIGFVFPPETSRLDSLMEMIRASQNWAVIESMEGKIIAGSTVTYPPLDVNSTYTFYRGKDVWSRDVVRDDEMVYTRICGKYETESEGVTTMNYVYADVVVEHEWITAPHKTLYIDLPKNTQSAHAEEIINDLAGRLGKAGVVETFVGPIRPQLLVGDTARVISDDGRATVLGTIVAIKHMMGRSGFITEFTVDSSGERGKLSLTELVQVASGADKQRKIGTVLYE